MARAGRDLVIGEKGHSPPDPVGRRSQRAEGVKNSGHETAPDLSRAEEVASPRDVIWFRSLVSRKYCEIANARSGLKSGARLLLKPATSSARRDLRPTVSGG